MSGKPAARITDPTACPIPGHGTNPIATGSADVIFDGLSAARLSDTSVCGSPIASAVSATVFINGLNAATLGSVGAHGNTIIAGSGTVIIGNSGGGAAFTPVKPLSIAAVSAAAALLSGQTAAAFDDRFVLTDSKSGKPLANRHYAIKRENGQMEYGQSDEQGLTCVISCATHAESIEIYVED